MLIHHKGSIYSWHIKKLQLSLSKKKKYKITSSKKKKKLPHVKTTHSYFEISTFKKKKKKKNSLKHSKIFFIQILYSYHKSPSIHTNVYHLFFVQISKFFTYHNFYPNQ